MAFPKVQEVSLIQEMISYASFKIYHRITEQLRLEGTSGGSSGPILLLKQSHLVPVAQDSIRTVFKCL